MTSIVHMYDTNWNMLLEQVKAHPFFKDINWDILARQKVTTKPLILLPSTVTHFLRNYSSAKIQKIRETDCLNESPLISSFIFFVGCIYPFYRWWLRHELLRLPPRLGHRRRACQCALQRVRRQERDQQHELLQQPTQLWLRGRCMCAGS